MQSTLTATNDRPRRRLGRMLLAVAVAACVLPAAAQAGVVEEAANGTLVYRAATGESNNLSVSNEVSGAVSIRDLTGLTERTPLCDEVSNIRVNCVPDTRLSEVRLGDRNDNFAIGVRGAVVVDAGPGDDGYTATNTTLASGVDYRGGEGLDSVSYSNADRGVRLINDGVANDGRIGFARDNIGRDVERLIGSAFGDEITAMGDATVSFPHQSITGGRGNDTLRDGPGSAVTFFDMGSVADGADDIIGGSGESRLDYGTRTEPVNVTLNFGGADDGEQVEGDEITGGNESVGGGSGDDTLRAPAGSTAFHRLTGGEGADRLEGADGPDTLRGDSDADTIIANGGDDLVEARDNVGDVIGCGAGTDTAELDPNTVDVFSSCENRRVGVLRLAPKRLRAEAGQTAQLKLSWRHPRSWRRLHRIELRLVDEGIAAGAVTIRPRGQRVSANGAIRLARRSRLARKGKTVSARLRLRLDRNLAGRRLRVEVEAVDLRGARQLESRAGSISVSR
jgi:hypothetical protein